MTVPPVPEVPVRYFTWNTAFFTASPVTESNLNTTKALRGVFSKVTVLLSPALTKISCAAGSLMR